MFYQLRYIQLPVVNSPFSTTLPIFPCSEFCQTIISKLLLEIEKATIQFA